MGSDRDLPDTLYHYTDINGLKGIWEDGHLWATGFRFLNDTSELRLGMLLLQSKVARRQTELYEETVEILKRELELRKDERPVDDAYFAALEAKNAPELRELAEISAAAEDAEKYMHSHIACLSERDDQLSQWRAYAREGYCVGFDTKLLLESLNDDQVMRRVHYFDETANEAYASQIIEIAKQHRRVMLEHPDLVDVDEEGRRWIIALRMTVHASFVKDRGFARRTKLESSKSTVRQTLSHRIGTGWCRGSSSRFRTGVSDRSRLGPLHTRI